MVSSSSSTEVIPVKPIAPIRSPLEKVTSQVEALPFDPPLTQPEPEPQVLELNGEAVNTSTEQQPIAIPPAQPLDIDVLLTSLATSKICGPCYSEWCTLVEVTLIFKYLS